MTLERLLKRIAIRLRPVRLIRLRGGLVSVVVPAYNVDRYIALAIESVLAQSYRNLEVIVVDDGSDDATASEIARVAATDSRVVVVHSLHVGVNAARNRAIEKARGEFLGFLDGDDLMAAGAIEAMVAAMRRYGTDFAVGAYDRLEGNRLVPAMPWIRHAHAVDRPLVTAADYPDIMVNAMQWSRLYRRSFFRRHVAPFPGPGFYQDQIVSMRAYAHAAAITVLERTVVHWRARRDGSSMTQQMLSRESMHARSSTASEGYRIIRDGLGERAGRERLVQYLNHDILIAADQLLFADEDYWADFRERLAGFMALVDDDALWAQVQSRHRLLFHLIAEDRRDEALAFVARVPGTLEERRYLRWDGGWRLDDPLWDDADVPRELFRATAIEAAFCERFSASR